MKNLLIPLITLLTISSCAIFTNKDTAGEFPIYGNWCGPDHPKTGTNPKPIDNTDLSCKHHDLCYAENGYLNATCDENLITELKANTPQNEIEAIARKAIISYFRKSPKL